jgi:hypothetical protein
LQSSGGRYALKQAGDYAVGRCEDLTTSCLHPETERSQLPTSPFRTGDPADVLYTASVRVVIALVLSLSLAANAERGVLVVSTRSAANTPLPHIRIATVGDGSTGVTDDTGRGRIRLSPETRPGASVTLQVVPPPDLVFISPWGGRTPVPPFENESDNYVEVVLARRGDRRALENAAVLAAVVAQSVSTKLPKPSKSPEKSKATHRPISDVYHPGTVSLVAIEFGQSSIPSQYLSENRPLVTEQGAQRFGYTKKEVEQELAKWNTDMLSWKIIVLTGRVEFGSRDPFSSVVGSIDDTGISFGIGLWDVRHGTLLPLLSKMRALDSVNFDQIMAPDQKFVEEWLKQPADRALELTQRHILREGSSDVSGTWKTRFAELGRTPEFQRVQVDALHPRVNAARELCVELGLHSERAVAFLYDTAFSQGNGFTFSFKQDQRSFGRIIGRQPDEQEKLLLLANRASNRVPQPLRSFMRQRYVAFASGRGAVHGVLIDLNHAGLGMFDFESGRSVTLVNDGAMLKRLKDGWLPDGTTQ